MKLRLIALAGVAASALASPAMAGEGWYLGLAGGIAEQNGVSVRSVPLPASLTGKAQIDTGGIVALQTGYKFDNDLRLEVESSYSWHDLTKTAPVTGGGTQMRMSTLNLLWDIPLDPDWSISLGGGLGVGSGYIRATSVTAGVTYDLVRASDVNFAYTGIAAINYHLSEDLDLSFRYAYRSILVDRNGASAYLALSPVHVGNFTENAFMLGLTWFLTPPPPPPPP
ncbi:MAG: outer membrane beta-barrel protein, partial [Alphaproteobacteria bacterium]|nr:outer membrane beta-barrel protein [Alphaproteobacteria bacterium]